MHECGAIGCSAKTAALKCGRCQGVFYCNADCQKTDWKRHKPFCKPFAHSAPNKASVAESGGDVAARTAAAAGQSTRSSRRPAPLVLVPHSTRYVDRDLFMYVAVVVGHATDSLQKMRRAVPATLSAVKLFMSKGGRPAFESRLRTAKCRQQFDTSSPGCRTCSRCWKRFWTKSCSRRLICKLRLMCRRGIAAHLSKWRSRAAIRRLCARSSSTAQTSRGHAAEIPMGSWSGQCKLFPCTSSPGTAPCRRHSIQRPTASSRLSMRGRVPSAIMLVATVRMLRAAGGKTYSELHANDD